MYREKIISLTNTYMYEIIRVIPRTFLGWSQVCLQGLYVCCLGGVTGSVHLHGNLIQEHENRQKKSIA